MVAKAEVDERCLSQPKKFERQSEPMSNPKQPVVSASSPRDKKSYPAGSVFGIGCKKKVEKTEHRQGKSDKILAYKCRYHEPVQTHSDFWSDFRPPPRRSGSANSRSTTASAASVSQSPRRKADAPLASLGLGSACGSERSSHSAMSVQSHAQVAAHLQPFVDSVAGSKRRNSARGSEKSLHSAASSQSHAQSRTSVQPRVEVGSHPAPRQRQDEKTQRPPAKEGPNLGCSYVERVADPAVEVESGAAPRPRQDEKTHRRSEREVPNLGCSYVERAAQPTKQPQSSQGALDPAVTHYRSREKDSDSRSLSSDRASSLTPKKGIINSSVRDKDSGSRGVSPDRASLNPPREGQDVRDRESSKGPKTGAVSRAKQDGAVKPAGMQRPKTSEERSESRWYSHSPTIRDMYAIRMGMRNIDGTSVKHGRAGKPTIETQDQRDMHRRRKLDIDRATHGPKPAGIHSRGTGKQRQFGYGWARQVKPQQTL